MSDLISKSWLVEALESSGIADSEEDAWVHSFVMGMIADAPTVEAKPVVRGHWIFVQDMIPYYRCSNCSATNDYALANYCPNCGCSMKSDMRGGKNE